VVSRRRPPLREAVEGRLVPTLLIFPAILWIESRL
jgi:hypothetical protein